MKTVDESIINTIRYPMYTAKDSKYLDKEIQKKARSVEEILNNRKKMTIKDAKDALEVMDALYQAGIGAGDKANAKHYLEQILEYLQK